MNTEARTDTKDDAKEESNLLKKIHPIVSIVVIIGLIVVIIVLAASPGGGAGCTSNDAANNVDATQEPSKSPTNIPSAISLAPSPSPTGGSLSPTYDVFDESDFDDGSDISSLDCTPSPKVWGAGFYTIDICDGLYAFGDNFYGGMYLVTSTGVIFVDAPPSMSHILPAIIAAHSGANTLTTMIYTHHHGDHIGGTRDIPNIDNANIVCHRNVYAALERRPDIAPQCTTVLDLTTDRDTYIIEDGDKYVVLKYAGYQHHTNGDLMVFLPRQRTVMTVDIVYPKWIPFQFLGLASDPDGYTDAHHYLLSITSSIYGDWENLVAGHVDQLGVREDVNINLQYVADLIDAVHNASHNPNLSFYSVYVNDGPPDGTNNWAIVKTYQQGIMKECTRIMIEELKWNETFHGMYEYNDDNCYWAFQESHINIERR